MNNIIKNLINENFDRFVKLVNMGIIDKKDAHKCIVETNNAEYIYYFALKIKEANIPELESAIIKTNNAEYIYLFALDIKGANITKLEDAIIKTQNAQYIYLFAQNVKGANIRRLYQALLIIKEKDFTVEEYLIELKNRYKELNHISNDVEHTNIMNLIENNEDEETTENKENYANLFQEENPTRKLVK